MTQRWKGTTRRSVLKAGGIAGATLTGLSGIVGAQGNGKGGKHRIRGRIVRPDGEAASHDRIQVEPIPSGPNQFYTRAGGSFLAEVDPDDKADVPSFDEGEYDIGYYRIPPNDNGTGVVRDGNPDIADLGLVDASKGIGNLGTVHLADGHVLEVKVLNAQDEPAPNVRVRVGHGNYGMDGYTNQDGLLKFNGADDTGIELPDTDESGTKIHVSVGPNVGSPNPPQQFDLTADRTLVFNEDGGQN